MIFQKLLSAIKGAKGAGITPDMLAKINAFALTPLTAEGVYVRKHLLAHNGIDRDRERFSEPLLADFARTLPGKSFLVGHSRPDPGIGLWFDAFTEEITPEEFERLTGEKIILPAAVTKATVLMGMIYMVKADFNAERIANIEAGVYRHVSIGFKASDLIPVKGEYDQILYFEYIPPGEAREGSVVWLGAQQGATSQKQDNAIESYKSAIGENAKEDAPTLNAWIRTIENNKSTKDNRPAAAPDTDKEGGKEDMDELKKLLEKLSKEFKTLFTAENISAEIRSLVDAAGAKADGQLTAKAAELKALQDKVNELTPLAADGRAYRKELVDGYVANKAKLGEVTEDPEEQKGLRAVVEAYPITFLKAESGFLQKRVEEKFPDKPQTKGDDSRDKSGDNGSEDDISVQEDKE